VHVTERFSGLLQKLFDLDGYGRERKAEAVVLAISEGSENQIRIRSARWEGGLSRPMEGDSRTFGTLGSAAADWATEKSENGVWPREGERNDAEETFEALNFAPW
jgi:hypothetical protein